jgi:RND family efflux transporter MFP subunit
MLHHANTSAIIALCVLLSGCGREEEPVPDVVRPVKIIALGASSGEDGLEYPGSVSSSQEARLSFEVDGQLLEFPVVEGQAVRAGQLLARLDDRDYVARRNADRASRNQALANYERFQELYAADAVSLQDLEVSRREYEVSQAGLGITEKAVEDTELHARFSGVVARTLVEEFENVSAGQPVLLLQTGGELEMRVNIPERDVVFAPQGLSVDEMNTRASPRVEISALPGRRYPGRLTEFATAADPVTRTFRATVAFDAPGDVQVLPGMTGKVIIDSRFVGGESGRFLIPAAAVAPSDTGEWYVWRVDQASMQVSRVAVGIGAMSGSDIEISGDLDLGDLVATSGVHHLRAGMTVSRAIDRRQD